MNNQVLRYPIADHHNSIDSANNHCSLSLVPVLYSSTRRTRLTTSLNSSWLTFFGLSFLTFNLFSFFPSLFFCGGCGGAGCRLSVAAGICKD